MRCQVKMAKRALLMDVSDDVATVIEAVSAGDSVVVTTKDGKTVCELTAASDIPRFHKICLRPRAASAQVRKYGEVIGRATKNIGRGEYVHIHNVESIKTGVHA